MPVMRSIGLRKGTKEPLMFSHTPATRFVLMCFVLGMMCLILGIPECKQVNSGGPLPVRQSVPVLGLQVDGGADACLARGWWKGCEVKKPPRAFCSQALLLAAPRGKGFKPSTPDAKQRAGPGQTRRKPFFYWSDWQNARL